MDNSQLTPPHQPRSIRRATVPLVPGTLSETIRNHAAFVWSVADLLRGDYKQSEYGQVILPLTVIRRLDCVLEATKQAVLDKHTLLADRIENPGAGISWPLRAPALRPRQCRKSRSPSGDHPRRVSPLPHNLPTFRPMSQNTGAPQGCLCQAAALCRGIRGL